MLIFYFFCTISFTNQPFIVTIISYFEICKFDLFNEYLNQQKIIDQIMDQFDMKRFKKSFSDKTLINNTPEIDNSCKFINLLNNLEIQKNTLQNLIHQKNVYISLLQNKLEPLQNTFYKDFNLIGQQNEIQSLKRQYKSLKQQKLMNQYNFQIERNKIYEQMQSMKDKFNRQKINRQNWLTKLRQQNNRIRQLLIQLENQKQELVNNIDFYKSKYRLLINERQELDHLKKKSKILEEESLKYKQISSENQLLKSKLSYVQKEFHSTMAQNSALTSNSLNSKIICQALQKQRQQLILIRQENKTELSSLKQKCKVNEEQFNLLKKQAQNNKINLSLMNDLQIQKQTIMSQLQNIKAKHQYTLQQLSYSKERIKLLETQNNKIYNQNKQLLQEYNNLTKQFFDKISESKQYIKKLQKENNALNADNKRVVQDLQNLKNKYISLQAQQEKEYKNNSQLKMEINHITQQIQLLKDHKEQYEQIQNKAQQQIQKNICTIQNLNKQLQSRDKQIVYLKNKYQQENKELMTNKSKLNEYEFNMETKDQKISNLMKQIETLNIQNVEKRKQIQNLQMQLKIQFENNTNFNKIKQQQQNKIKQLEQLNNQLVNLKNQFKQQTNELRKNWQKEKDRNQDMGQILKQYHHNIENKKDYIDQIIRQNGQIIIQNQELSKQIYNLRIKLNQEKQENLNTQNQLNNIKDQNQIYKQENLNNVTYLKQLNKRMQNYELQIYNLEQIKKNKDNIIRQLEKNLIDHQLQIKKIQELSLLTFQRQQKYNDLQEKFLHLNQENLIVLKQNQKFMQKLNEYEKEIIQKNEQQKLQKKITSNMKEEICYLKKEVVQLKDQIKYQRNRNDNLQSLYSKVNNNDQYRNLRYSFSQGKITKLERDLSPTYQTSSKSKQKCGGIPYFGNY